MKVLFLLAIINVSLIQIGWAQDKIVDTKIDLYENSLEKQYLTEFQDNPFYLLQALEAHSENSTHSWQRVVAKLDKNRHFNSRRFLNQMYILTQQHLLKDYAQYASFSKTLDKGRFDCVTGTATYARLLEKYAIPYQIIMTGQHVYIKGSVNEIPFIIESTFPINGFVFGQEAVKSFESKVVFSDITPDNITAVVGNPYYFKTEYEIIGLRELAGLQYYNDAIKKFYEEDYPKSYIQLMKAEFLYPSNKISVFKQKMEVLLGVR